MFQLTDEQPLNRRPLPPSMDVIPRRKGEDNDGPRDLTDKIQRPDSRSILDRMKRVDPNQAKRYRQRSGE